MSVLAVRPLILLLVCLITQTSISLYISICHRCRLSLVGYWREPRARKARFFPHSFLSSFFSLLSPSASILNRNRISSLFQLPWEAAGLESCILVLSERLSCEQRSLQSWSVEKGFFYWWGIVQHQEVQLAFSNFRMLHVSIMLQMILKF